MILTIAKILILGLLSNIAIEFVHVDFHTAISEANELIKLGTHFIISAVTVYYTIKTIKAHHDASTKKD